MLGSVVMKIFFFFWKAIKIAGSVVLAVAQVFVVRPNYIHENIGSIFVSMFSAVYLSTLKKKISQTVEIKQNVQTRIRTNKRPIDLQLCNLPLDCCERFRNHC